MRLLALALLSCLTATAAADYREHPRAAELLRTLQAEYGFSAEDLDEVRAALGEAERVPKLVEADQNNKEQTLTWTAYAPIHVSAANIRRGAEFLANYRELLARAESEFGVPPAVVAAILGVETKFGAYATPHRVLDALATQGFEHPTRAAFFFRELTEFFVLCRDMDFEPRTVKGSYAGAMGAAQFMPSNYRRLALDFDSNGRRDLWALPDAIGSIASYLVNYRPDAGFERGGPMLVPAKLNGPLPASFPRNQKKPTHAYTELAGLGISASIELPADEPVGLIELQLDTGTEYWLGLHNFFAIMTYNPRIFYAMAVAELAEAIQLASTPSP
jgi:membrane-bound lytic murein transglycosylase B